MDELSTETLLQIARGFTQYCRTHSCVMCPLHIENSYSTLKCAPRAVKALLDRAIEGEVPSDS